MTARYKGRASAKSIERENPNIVELAVPPNGLGKTMDLIVTFHANLRIPILNGTGRYDEGQYYVRFCFKNPQEQASFQALFGGTILPGKGAR